MVSCPYVGIVLLVGVAAAGAAQGGAKRQAAEEVPMVVDYVNVPTTLEDAVSRAHAIVRARVSDPQVRARTVNESSIATVVNTVFRLNVVDVLKQPVGMPEPEEVLREGGELVTEKGTRRVVEDGFPMFDTNDEYLLFLFWNDYLGIYQPAFGPDAAFRITPDGLLKGLGQGPLSKLESGRDALDVEDRIRQRAALPQPEERQ